ncbi:MMPL/RND family transporter [Mycolicibacterium smegmatis]|uniref:Conserved transmembrane transport protein MmpL1 n=3 Tax=Mycolicibacterium smegmatis TaxID=1772 RepID=I7GC15_MYCS2|nr:MMPL family transporter [Mycolicibacterium smegmatis]ABK69899.1 MmpL5 protein [Mycolicibacterium smegmatis MC2 155]AFP40736.1 Conserved transmembrane transport protein MmpL1 [Mycolicibacterium smegmatis MC2 155]AIU09468.1 membrane protein [Mycolicibacterium smegmatis MC2 155]AIU16093.1 membrane protein [Mycolicibacterium smegmatis]AIU22716.1 membrane protein [Mycolicibacterium smegmatis]
MAVSTDRPAARESEHTGIARWIRRLAIPIILGWIALLGVLGATVPSLEEVGQMRSVSMSPDYAPSVIAMKRVGEVFEEFKSDSSAMIVLEGDEPLGDDAHIFYNDMVDRLEADTEHVEHVQDFWGDPLTEAGAQSNDGRAAYVQVFLAGNMGEALANESVQAVQELVEGLQPPPGVKVYVTGGSALANDQQISGDRSVRIIEAVTFLVIITMLLLVYRSIVTVLITLFLVVICLQSARGVVAFLGYHELIGLSTFATQLLVTLAIAASTDYAIFLIGRYQEARTLGESKEQAYYTMFRGTAHVVLGSGMTIAGATLCLHFTRLPYFQTLGIPMAVGMTIAVVAALTLGPAVITVMTRFGKILEPKRAMRIRGWRRLGAFVVRWPGAVLMATVLLSLVGLLALPGYRTNYNDRNYLPDDLPAQEGFAAAERHFSPAKMNPELLLIETDHDIRNSADFLVIDKIAKAVFRVPGIGSVQAITRPQGEPLEFSTIPAQMSMGGTLQTMNRKYMLDRADDMLLQADEMQRTIELMGRTIELMEEMAATTHSMVGKTHLMVEDVKELRDNISNFDDFLRPLRNYLYWEPHCYDIPMCHSMRSIFDALDGMDTMTEAMEELLPDMDRLDALMPRMVALMPPQIETMRKMRTMMLTMHQTQKGLQEQMGAMQEGQTAMGEAFNTAKNDDTFYLPPEIFNNADFKRGMDSFISPDGKAVRFIISHEGDPLTPEGIKLIDQIKLAAKEAMKNTPWEGSKIYVGGTAAAFKDMQEGNNYDLIIAGISALCLIFIIMLLITRSVVAAAVIVGTVLVSLGASFGLSILVWQHILGIDLHFMVMAMAVIVLLAVGADYNLLLVARLKEELPAGINTGIIRAMGGSGSVVTAAGLVFAFTMMSMLVSEMTVVAQVGTTIGMGLLFDTLVIRSFMTPSIAALLGRWFWWPQVVRARPARGVVARALERDKAATH